MADDSANGERPANLLAEVVEILRQYLTEVQDTSKAPSGFDTALENLSGDGITRSFLEAGFQTWFAFFLAADRDPKLQHSVEQLPLSTIRRIAKEASNIKAHPSMTARIQHILFGSNRGPKRCKLLTLNKTTLPEVLEAPRSEPRLLKRPRIEGVQQRHVPSSSSSAGPQDMCINDAAEIVQVEEHPGFVSGDDLIVPSTSHMETSATIDFDINPQYHYARPKAKNLPFVFPPDPAGCCMTVDLMPAEVQHIARELFGIHVRESSEGKCIIFEHGATVVIKGSAVFKGADEAALERLFGQMVGTAFRLNPQRLEELAMGALKSNCLSMEVWEKPDHPGRLTFIMDAENMSLVYQQLWSS
ncbi:hypothetical protein ACCO45_012646 [Purpureocillium lilacinum]|uniref:Uncharacterized protein n=1 Tax=Purpureocillium lilacinum TaxID=33203 RepID=A0ACC4DBN9_PURLI